MSATPGTRGVVPGPWPRLATLGPWRCLANTAGGQRVLGIQGRALSHPLTLAPPSWDPLRNGCDRRSSFQARRLSAQGKGRPGPASMWGVRATQVWAETPRLGPGLDLAASKRPCTLRHLSLVCLHPAGLKVPAAAHSLPHPDSGPIQKPVAFAIEGTKMDVRAKAKARPSGVHPAKPRGSRQPPKIRNYNCKE